jgi:archaea-specific RecJ-like exonuclease
MKNNKKSFSKKGNSFHKKKNFHKEERPTEEVKIEEITQRSLDHIVKIEGIIDSIIQTPGPTLFNIVDGTGIFALKGFEGAGVRAYPEVEEGDAIQAVAKVKEFNGMIEGEIIKLTKLSSQESQKIKKNIEEMLREKSEAKPIPFLVKSKILDKLQPSILKAATEIRLSIAQNRPIIVRHHNDADGYSSGYALEKAILPLIRKQHGTDKAMWMLFTRAPCSAPFYEIDDSIRDTARSLAGEAKFSEKMPLVIIVDNGSSAEDLLAIQQGKVHGIDFVVVDHHFFDKDVISKEVLVHINPFLVGEDGSEFSAGMLCVELARFVNPETERLEHIPALAGMADRINNPKVMEDYLKVAQSKGYTKTLLNQTATVIDFVSAKVRFMEVREYIDVLFGKDPKKQKELVGIIAPHIQKLADKAVQIGKSAATKEVYNGVTLQLLMVEETFSRFAYPKPGQSVGLLHDFVRDKENTPNIVTVGVLQDLVTIRATEPSGFSVHKFMAHLNKNLPEAFADGGGHHLAGAIRFVPAKRKEVLQELRKFVGKK